MAQVCRMYLRKDQSLSLRESYSSKEVKVFAPTWVKHGISELSKHIQNMHCVLHDNPTSQLKPGQTISPSGNKYQPVESFIIAEEIKRNVLLTLQRIARNESANLNGRINVLQYQGIDERVILAVKDLVRQCVIAGVDYSSNCGGYRCIRETQGRQRVYICDMSAFQFQKGYNTGRLVLIKQETTHQGLLDDFIYENVVGEQKKSFGEIHKVYSKAGKVSPFRQRYISIGGEKGSPNCYIDTVAYRRFVKEDVILYGLAICKIVREFHPNDKIHLKFLKYGTGILAGKFADILEDHILPAVLDGLEILLSVGIAKEIIKRVELPFYNFDLESGKRISILESTYGLKILLTMSDALKQSDQDGLLISTTNCGDTHAVCGNQMGYTSVDAAIAENLESKANIFCPNINRDMGEEFIDMKNPEVQLQDKKHLSKPQYNMDYFLELSFNQHKKTAPDPPVSILKYQKLQNDDAIPAINQSDIHNKQNSKNGNVNLPRAKSYAGETQSKHNALFEPKMNVGQQQLLNNDFESCLKLIKNSRFSDNEYQELSKTVNEKLGYTEAATASKNASYMIDSTEFSSFVTRDVALFGKTVCFLVKANSPNNDNKILLKFLRCGCRTVNNNFPDKLEKILLLAILDGIDLLFEENKTIFQFIGQIELPVLSCDTASAMKIRDIYKRYGIEVNFSEDPDDDDVNSKRDGLIVAATNCGDAYSCCGSKRSTGTGVSAAIAQNIPKLNTKSMEEEIHTKKAEEQEEVATSQPTLTPTPDFQPDLAPNVAENSIASSCLKPSRKKSAPPPPPPSNLKPTLFPSQAKEMGGYSIDTVGANTVNKPSAPATLLSQIQSFDIKTLKSSANTAKTKEYEDGGIIKSWQSSIVLTLEAPSKTNEGSDDDDDKWETEV